MARTHLKIASEGLAHAAGTIVAARDRDAYRLSFLTEDGQRLTYAASLTRAQVMALAGMLGALLDEEDPYAVAVD